MLLDPGHSRKFISSHLKFATLSRSFKTLLARAQFRRTDHQLQSCRALIEKAIPQPVLRDFTIRMRILRPAVEDMVLACFPPHSSLRAMYCTVRNRRENTNGGTAEIRNNVAEYKSNDPSRTAIFRTIGGKTAHPRYSSPAEDLEARQVQDDRRVADHVTSNE